MMTCVPDAPPARLSPTPEREILRLIDSGVPVLVLFTGDWCGACRATVPLFEEAAARDPGSLRYVLADVERCEGLAADAGVSRLPAAVLFLDGADEAALSGRFTRAELARLVALACRRATAPG